MKGTKQLLILALPLMAAGCGGSSFTSGPVPPVGVDAEGIFEGTAGNGDSLFGIIAADGTAMFLEYPDAATVPPAATQGAIIVPKAVLPDENGAFSVAFTDYANNGFTYPSGDALASSFSGTADTSHDTLSGSYLTKSSAPVTFITNYDADNYENGPAPSSFVGTYTANFFIGSVADTANVIIDDQGGVDVTETTYGCHYSGQWSVPNVAGNAYEISFAYTACADAHGQLSMTGLASLFDTGNTMFAIMYDKGREVGVFFSMTKVS